MKPELSIIIPTVGREEILNRTLHSLLDAIKGMNVEVILVDDSINGIPFPEFFDGIIVMKSKGLGAGAARNVGYREAKSDLLLFLDDDMIINRYNIERVLELHKQHEKKAYNFFWLYPPDLISSLYDFKFGRFILDFQLFSNAFRFPFSIKKEMGLVKVEGISSQFFSIEKKWITAVGGYDELPYAGAEDHLLYKKLSALGIEVFVSFRDIVFQYEINRLRLIDVMNRYRRGNFTRKLAFDLGHQDLNLNWPKWKQAIGWLLIHFKPLILSMCNLIPYGRTYKRLARTGLFLSTFEGFYKDRLPSQPAD